MICFCFLYVNLTYGSNLAQNCSSNAVNYVNELLIKLFLVTAWCFVPWGYLTSLLTTLHTMTICGWGQAWTSPWVQSDPPLLQKGFLIHCKISHNPFDMVETKHKLQQQQLALWHRPWRPTSAKYDSPTIHNSQNNKINSLLKNCRSWREWRENQKLGWALRKQTMFIC